MRFAALLIARPEILGARRLTERLASWISTVVAGLACALTSPLAVAESWQVVYTSTYRTTAGYGESVRSIDIDSIAASGEYLSYRAKSTGERWMGASETMAVDCKNAKRGQWQDLRMYSVYPETLGGNEARAVCQAAQRAGLIASAGDWPATASAATASPARPVAVTDEEWTKVSSDGRRQVETKSLRTTRPVVAYNLRYGDGNDSNSVVLERTRFAVEVDCSSRLRRDILLKDGSTPRGPFVSVDDWGTPFIEEIYFVCKWAEAAWQKAPSVAAVAPAAVPKAVERSFGSGFVVSPRAVVTNFHVVDGCRTVAVRRDAETYTATVHATSERSDLALLSVNAVFAASPPIRGNGALGEDVTVAGHPLAGLLSTDLVVTSGQVNSLAGLGNDPTMLQISAPVQPGNSGGPLIDRGGAVVGVVVSKLNVQRLAKLTGDMAQNVNFAIKPEVLRMFLEANRVPFRSAALTKRLDGVEIAERARAFTVQVLCTN